MGGADENWSDISNHQSAMQSHPTAYLLNPCTPCMGAEDVFVKVFIKLTATGRIRLLVFN